jgi:(E)-4-hydroxy-3-methylbut-2-enyl-diphosphate synthase
MPTSASPCPAPASRPAAPVFEDGVKTQTLRGDNIASEFKTIIERYVVRTYRRKGAPA